MAIDGDYIVVGAPQEAGKGALYVFQKGSVNTTWAQVAYLTDVTGLSEDWSGASVSISGNYVIGGAPTNLLTSPSTGNGSCFYLPTEYYHGRMEFPPEAYGFRWSAG